MDSFDVSHLTEAELEFLSEDTMIEIIPSFKGGIIRGLLEDCGPFMPNVPVAVPLWLAIQLKKANKCSIKPPEWLNPEKLDRKFAEEKEPDKFTDMPFHYQEIFHLLLYYCPDDIPNLQRVKTCMNDLYNLRNSKIKAGVKSIVGSDSDSFKLNGLTSMELCILRKYLLPGLNQVQKYGTQTIDNHEAD